VAFAEQGFDGLLPEVEMPGRDRHGNGERPLGFVAVFDQGGGVLGDRALLVGGDHEQAAAAVPGGDVEDGRGVIDLCVAVLVLVQACTEEVEPLSDPVAHRLAVLADAGGEDDRVDPAHGRRVGAYVLAHAVGEHLQREPAAFVALRGALLDVAHVVADP
jgi:hypothetical protein